MKNSPTNFASQVLVKLLILGSIVFIVCSSIGTFDAYKNLGFAGYFGQVAFESFKNIGSLCAFLLVIQILAQWNAITNNNSKMKAIEGRMREIESAGSNGENVVRETIINIAKSGKLGHVRFLDEQTTLLKPIHHGERSQEVDHLLLTEFGIFIIETKNYHGNLSLVNHGILCGDGVLRKNPLEQSSSKVKRMERFISSKAPVHSIAVFSSENVTLPSNCPDDMVYVRDLGARLGHYKTKHNESNRGNFSVDSLNALIAGLVESDPDAKRRHMLSIGQPEYCALDSMHLDSKQRAGRPFFYKYFGAGVALYCLAMYLCVLIMALIDYACPKCLSILSII